MRLIIGNAYMATPDGSSMTINSSASDPVSTCTVNIIDNTSAISIPTGSEIIVIDDQVYANPAFNLLLNPSLLPYNVSPWSHSTGAGSGSAIPTLSQTGGGGMTAAFGVGGNGTGEFASVFQTTVAPIAVGQTYCFSFTTSGSSISNMELIITIAWLNPTGTLATTTNTITGITNATTQYSLSSVAPAGAIQATVTARAQATAAGVSGSDINFTQMQFEPQWFPTLSYPTPWVGPGQTNCQQLPLGWWIRQYRKFAGFVTKPVYGAYHGNVRTITVNAVGYAWLAGTILANDSFTSQTDSAIITSLLNKYLVTNTFFTAINAITLATTTNVVTGVTVSDLQSNWDDLRTLFDNLASLSGFYWTIDPYWNFIYAPPGYINQGIGLIGDNSGPPDLKKTFPMYNFSYEDDFTQPGSTILVLGSGSNVAEVIDPSQTMQLGFTTGYFLPTGTSWMRKVSDSTLQSTTDCTTRGIAELLQYDYSRGIYHLTTQRELIAGQSVAVTSNTDNLNNTQLLVQQVQAQWIGTSETLTDQWAYAADLGATNRLATHIISRIFRQTQRGTSAPAIATTTLAVFEKIGVAESSIGTGTAPATYFVALQPDTPIGLFPLNEITGTIADDISGNANQGTINGGVTLGAAGLLTDPADTADTAMTFNGSTGYISLPAALNGNGLSAFSVEIWCSLSTGTLGSFTGIVCASTGANTNGYQLGWASTTALNWIVGNGSSSATAAFTTTATAGVTLYLAGTYDGANIRLYVNGVLKATTALTGTISTANVPIIGADTSSTHFFPGTNQYAGFYNYTLSAAQVLAHYNAGI